MFHRCWNTRSGQTVSNIAGADPSQLPLENIAHHICGVFVNHQFVVLIGIFLIAKGGKRADEISALPFDLQLTSDFNRGITAICLIYQVLKGNDQIVGAFTMQAVIIIIDGNKSDAKEGENPLDILS